GLLSTRTGIIASPTYAAIVSATSGTTMRMRVCRLGRGRSGGALLTTADSDTPRLRAGTAGPTIRSIRRVDHPEGTHAGSDAAHPARHAAPVRARRALLPGKGGGHRHTHRHRARHLRRVGGSC